MDMLRKPINGSTNRVKYHATIMDMLRKPTRGLMMLLMKGDDVQKGSAARCIQFLTHNARARAEFASFSKVMSAWRIQFLTHNARARAEFASFSYSGVLYDENFEPMVDEFNGLQAVLDLCGPLSPVNHRTYGAGILRNFTGFDYGRQEILKLAQSKTSPVLRLLRECDKGSVSAKSRTSPVFRLLRKCDKGSVSAKAHAAAALGNLCTNEQAATRILNCGGDHTLRCLVAVAKVDSSPVDAERVFVADCRINATVAIANIVFSEKAAQQAVTNGFPARATEFLGSRAAPALRLAAAKAVHNLSAFDAGVSALIGDCPIVDRSGLLERVVKGCKTDEREVQEHLGAVLCNISTDEREVQEYLGAVLCNISVVESEVQEHLGAVLCNISVDHVGALLDGRGCRSIIHLLKHGHTAQIRLYAATIVKNAGRMAAAAPELCEPLVSAGLFGALAHALKEGVQISGGIAEVAACATVRFAASNPDYAIRIVAAHGLANMLDLLGSGCVSAQIQACKALLFFSEKEEYISLLVSVGAISVVQRVMNIARAGALFDYGAELVSLFIKTGKDGGQGLSMLEKRLAARLVEEGLSMLGKRLAARLVEEVSKAKQARREESQHNSQLEGERRASKLALLGSPCEVSAPQSKGSAGRLAAELWCASPEGPWPNPRN
ncbi:armadillo-type protein [Baffinella frigidus]|nr:armadillo-type protein [Cryptophyta sp. CCMP2293]